MFTKSELSGILQALQTVEDATIIPVKSGGGVCSRQHIVKGLNGLIDSGKSRISFNEASKLLDVDDKYISAIVSALPEDEWGLNGREIIPKQPFAHLENTLRTHLASRVVTVITYSREENITIEFLKKLVAYLEREWDLKVYWLGERYIYSQKFLEGVVERVKDDVKDAEAPVEFEELTVVKEGNWPVEFGQKVLGTVGREDAYGTWTGGTFVPSIYKTHRQDEVVDILKNEGIIAVKAVKRGYIDKPDEFLRKRVGEVSLLKEHYVTKEWLEGVMKAAEKELEDNGVTNVKELASKLTPEEQLNVQELFRKKQTRKLLEHGGCLITRELLDELLKSCFGYAKEEAERTWAATEKGTATEKGRPIALTSITSWRSLSAFFMKDDRLLQAASDSIAQSFLPKVSASYSDRIGELREMANAAARVQFVDKVYLRFVINRAAIEKIQDPGVQGKLAQDLMIYYQKMIVDGLTKLRDRVADTQSQRMNERIEDAISTVTNVFSSDDIKPIAGLHVIQQELESLMKDIGVNRSTGEEFDASVKNKMEEMRNELRVQLGKASDLSLMLLVVLILLFSEHEGGILRATGKYAPKILKQLRHRLTDADYEFLNYVKGAVIARSSVGGEDVERLRAWGSSQS
ncbi:hypothetical protein TWF679_010798 [Orbilia oligospora]|uniref:Uncharacterized protein n=1 Tax=Orbilia oligospora TaxID=2813651 RepID=A0A8H8UZL1_ORBOL|nr:hypothetical protein TWF679_010798 [Orbilia oligospora]